MAIEYHLDASPVMSDTEALDYFAAKLGCEQRHTATFAAGAALQVDTDIDTAEEFPDTAALLDVAQVLSVTFRQSKNLGDLGDAHAVRDMLVAVTQFFEDFPDAKGVFAFNFETILVQRLGDDGIILDQGLFAPEGDNRHGTLDELRDKYPVRAIDQVLL
ncbi:SitI3 family protein [Glycomyces tenuis]|uniref:SitI3 family protein n=1 Tax=Glycomyces tenuis TaxID=58116 RepID=UPI000416AD3E|nr:SitI3 family protein [Glycomyces tenuis]